MSSELPSSEHQSSSEATVVPRSRLAMRLGALAAKFSFRRNAGSSSIPAETTPAESISRMPVELATPPPASPERQERAATNLDILVDRVLMSDAYAGSVKHFDDGGSTLVLSADASDGKPSMRVGFIRNKGGRGFIGVTSAGKNMGYASNDEGLILSYMRDDGRHVGPQDVLTSSDGVTIDDEQVAHLETSLSERADLAVDQRWLELTYGRPTIGQAV